MNDYVKEDATGCIILVICVNINTVIENKTHSGFHELQERSPNSNKIMTKHRFGEGR